VGWRLRKLSEPALLKFSAIRLAAVQLYAFDILALDGNDLTSSEKLSE
jgi:ATP-dependent DNA ligase